MIACQFLDLSAAALVFVGACVGHAALWTTSLNLTFSRPLPKRFLSLTRRALFLFILATPALFWFALGFDRGIELAPYPYTLCCPFMWGYTAVCLVIGLVVFPYFTLRARLRRRPAALVSNHRETIDVARQLGYRPVGHGKYHRLARVPANQIFQVDFVEQVFRLPRLPAAWDGLTLLHLSDLHLSGTPDREFYQFVLDRCREWEPDLVLVTGDVVDSRRHHSWIVPLLGRLRWRVAACAILGNHDYWYDPNLVRRRLRRLGMRVLDNTWETLEVRGEPLVVIGHEGPWFRPEPDLTACPEDPFRLCLSHTPDNIRWARRNRVDLMLSGHNHGGQIRLPVVGSIFVPSRFSRKYDCGLFHEPPTLLYVSRGLAGQHPIRINCRPEVTRIELRRGGDSQGAADQV
jgi:predicted MPP superfamily phosphohydrolase